MSEITESSLMLASSSVFCRRWTRRTGCATASRLFAGAVGDVHVFFIDRPHRPADRGERS